MIELKKITKRYGLQTVLDACDYTFSSQGLYCILGASGCGKTTLLNIIAGFDCNYQGELIVDQIPIHQLQGDALCNYRRDHIGFIFQNYNLLSGYSVIENIQLASKLQPQDSTNQLEQITSLLNRLGIEDKINEKVEHLSGGQKQRVAIARALIANPYILLADEPTGALDRTSATEIMELLKELSKERLVLVITHDTKITQYADRILTMQDGTLIGENLLLPPCQNNISIKRVSTKTPSLSHAYKNFCVHLKRYVSVSIIISIGILAFMLSLSFKNIMQASITRFQEENIAYQNGYIKVENNEDTLLHTLSKDDRISNIYTQYIMQDITLQMGKQTQIMPEKYPMPKAIEKMSYGHMPKNNKQQIALNPSLAKKFDSNISNLIGKTLQLTYGGQTYKLVVSGIFNAGYDDFFVSSNIEKRFYQSTTHHTPYAIQYDVTSFEDIVSVQSSLEKKSIKTQTAAKEVASLQTTFKNLKRLFLIVSILMLCVALFISIALLVKLQHSRYREVGLLSALGYRKKQIHMVILLEAILLSMLTALVISIGITFTYGIRILFPLPLVITQIQIIGSILISSVIVILIHIFASHKLIETPPAIALRK